MIINMIQYSITRYMDGGFSNILEGQCDTKPGQEFSYTERDSFVT